jgi:peptidoglycan/xylan/chitin deacetylase (PgdA/CDA1 family)
VRSALFARFLKQIPHKREFLARSLEFSGILKGLEKVSARRRPFLAIFTYHRIATPGLGNNPYYDPVISATPQVFLTQIQSLRKQFRLLTCDELLDILECRVKPLEHPSALITFDDGYLDNYQSALPILVEQGVPATFFIPTHFLKCPKLPWWDHVAYSIKHTRVSQFVLQRGVDDDNPLRITPGTESTERLSAIKAIVDLFLRGEITDEAWFLNQLDRQAKTDVDTEELGRGLFMDWNQVKKLGQAGMSIGSHGHTHSKLAGLGAEAQRQELLQSKEILESGLGSEVATIAYPYGWPGAFTAQTVQLARETGYRAGFSAWEGVNRLDDLTLNPLCLRRLNVGFGDSPTLLRARTLYRSLFTAPRENTDATR